MGRVHELHPSLLTEHILPNCRFEFLANSFFASLRISLAQLLASRGADIGDEEDILAPGILSGRVVSKVFLVQEDTLVGSNSERSRIIAVESHSRKETSQKG
jgi:hypothetical protein